MTVKEAVYAVLHADQQSTAAGSLGALGATGIYDEIAPQGAVPPYVVMHELPGSEGHMLGNHMGLRKRILLVKAVDVNDGTAISSLRASNLDDRCGTLLDDSLRQKAGLSWPIAVSGFTTVAVLRQHPFAQPLDRESQVEQYAGAQYEVTVQ